MDITNISEIVIVLVFVFVIGVGVTLVAKLHTPVSIADVNSFLSNAGTFITVTCAPLYGISKVADVMNKKTSKETDHA